MKTSILIGMGTGRSGTTSLAALLDAQRDARCFHELNPFPVRFATTPRPILNTIDEFQAIVNGGDPSGLTAGLSNTKVAKTYDRLCAMRSVRLIGDVSHYYLSYVERIAAHNPAVKFLCTRRDIDETVRSFMIKISGETWQSWRSKFVADYLHALILRRRYKPDRNPWMNHDGSVWKVDPIWDKCYPKFDDARDREDALRKYCEYYYREAERLADALGNRFCFVEMRDLNSRAGQKEVLRFAGIGDAEHVYPEVHENRTPAYLTKLGAPSTRQRMAE